MRLTGVGPETASLLPPLRRRQISDRLFWGILVFPLIFVWLLLWPGYTARLRISAFLFAGAVLYGLVQAIWSLLAP
ncbi:MAG TPA: hypothetical protein VEA44_19125 [Caulobacter sp.]|nr:hypothetical protein [Caulobacter sp.]